MDIQKIIEEIQQEITPCIPRGKVADYIPKLAAVPREKFGMAVHTIDDNQYHVGDAAEPFSIQSISKVFIFTLAFQMMGDDIWRRVGREPSGNPFNSRVQLEYENGIPRNPFINAGALVMVDAVISHHRHPENLILDFVRMLADHPGIGVDPEVAESERITGHRNAAMAHFLKSYQNLENEVEAVLNLYYYLCAISMSCRDLAKSFMFLANAGACPWHKAPIVNASQAKRINALMMTCGTYDTVGDFAYLVGLPGKSGVGGGISAVIPGRMTICAWSPGLNDSGNSLAGTLALELFTTKTGISIF
ncbi:MAG: glutaminase [Desulfobacteraceae bacterium]|nr:glutaminase [Desulfobacteraceae bacterium]